MITSPFLNLLCWFVIKRSQELLWREQLAIQSKVFRIDGKRQRRMIVPSSLKLVMQLLFQSLKLPLRELL